MYNINDRVRFKPYFPGDTWETEPWWVCGVVTKQDFCQHDIVTTYHVARGDDPRAQWPQTAIHSFQLMPWEERYRDERYAVDVARQEYLAQKNAKEV